MKIIANDCPLLQTFITREIHLSMVSIFLVVLSLILLTTLVIILFTLLRKRKHSIVKLRLKIKKQQKGIQLLIDEKEWLLKEIQHRVKNNLQIIMSLLNTQSSYIKDTVALSAIQESQHRIHAIALIHQKLYRSNNISVIHMQDYMCELIAYLEERFESKRYLNFELQATPLELDVSRAVPLGLILNEAITNAIQHSFPKEGRENKINITLTSSSINNWSLEIQDNGIGLPSNFDSGKTDTFGMNLIQGLTEDIGGTFFIENNQGTLITIKFVYEPISNYTTTETFAPNA